MPCAGSIGSSVRTAWSQESDIGLLLIREEDVWGWAFCPSLFVDIVHAISILFKKSG